MADYTFQLRNALTDDVVAELPASSASFSEVLNAPGAASVVVPLNTTSVGSAILPLQQSVVILRDAVPVWGGIIWGTAMDVRANTLTMNALGYWSLVRRRRIRSTLVYSGVDQALIAKGIVDALQAVPGGDMLIDTSVVTSVGMTRDRTYYEYERKNAAEAVEQLADVRGGFDFAIRPVFDSGSLVRRMTVSYPNTGRSTNIVLDVGTNVELLNATTDATTMSSVVHAKGEGENEEAIRLTLTNAPLLGAYPMVETLTVHSDVKEYSTLDAHGRRALDLGQTPMVIPSVQVYADTEPKLGTYVTGDQVRVRAQYGLLNIDATYRITQWVAVVAENGGETVTLSLAPLEVFSNA